MCRDADKSPSCRSSVNGYGSSRSRVPGHPLVTIIIPTRNAYGVLRRCILSLLRRTTYRNFEVIIVDNASDEPTAKRYLRRLQCLPGIRVIAYQGRFNYSAVNNLAVRQARGEIICLLNNDTEVITPGWVEMMIRCLSEDKVAVAGALLLYPDRTVQHAGVSLNPKRIAVHPYAHRPLCELEDLFRENCVEAVSAVTGACLMTWRRVYEQVGGFNEMLPIAFNDVDFCLRAQTQGFRVVWTPKALLYHYEKTTRGGNTSILQKLRFAWEKGYMRTRWHRRLNGS